MRVAVVAAVLGVALCVGTAAAEKPAEKPFDPRSYQARVVGAPTEILVIGTPHLSGTPDDFDPKALDPLLARLAAFKPDAIAIEALPGRTIDQMWAYRETYPDVAKSYGARATALAGLARAGVGLDMPEAEAEVRKTLAHWPASPAPADRRRLAALFAAAGDPSSAVVQWWRLPPAERKADDNVPKLLAEQLQAYESPARKNEDELIAARLAVRLGLERVYPMDDQSDDLPPGFEADFDGFSGKIYAGLASDPKFAPLIESRAHLRTPEEALATYRYINGPQAGQDDAAGQWLTLIDKASPGDVGRKRVGLWETRNLRMAANIREVAEQKPGGRVLVIVGSAHKPWLDAYLSMMTDVKIVSATAVLQ